MPKGENPNSRANLWGSWMSQPKNERDEPLVSLTVRVGASQAAWLKQHKNYNKLLRVLLAKAEALEEEYRRKHSKLPDWE